jgi:hypothetical protein
MFCITYRFLELRDVGFNGLNFFVSLVKNGVKGEVGKAEVGNGEVLRFYALDVGACERITKALCVGMSKEYEYWCRLYRVSIP